MMEGSYGRRRDCKKETEIEVLENDDLLQEILFHIPPVYVQRLKCVCKRWHKLISSSSFRRLHTVYVLRDYCSGPGQLLPSIFMQSHCNRREHLVLVLLNADRLAALKEDPDLSFSFIFHNYPGVMSLESRYCFKTLDSSNGLLLLASFNKGHGNQNHVFVCNPLTKDYIKLPPIISCGAAARSSGGSVVTTKLLGMNLVFDPLKSFHYKVVGICSVKHSMKEGNRYSTYRIHIYSSESHRWEVSKIFDVCPDIMAGIAKCVVMNGVLYWPPCQGGETILSFDSETLCLRQLSLPPQTPCNINRSWVYFGESRGHLYLMEKCFSYDTYNEQPFGYNIWEMKNEDCSGAWKLVLYFKFEGLSETLYIQSRGEEELQLFLVMGYFVHSLNLRSVNKDPYSIQSEWKYIGVFSHLARLNRYSDVERPLYPCDIIPYTNTLYPLV